MSKVPTIDITEYNNILETKVNTLYKESYKKVTILF